MKKLNKDELKEITEKLKPFWEEHEELQMNFRNKEEELQKKMNDSIKAGTDLEFFYVDGECVGIGAADFSERAKFPLIHDGELYS